MRTLFARYRVPPALGMTSLVLGHIALILFFLPVLGVPLAAFGLLFGVVGLFLTLFGPATSLRWSLAGLAVCCLALTVTLAIHYAPRNEVPPYSVPPIWQPPPDRPFVPPAAPPYLLVRTQARSTSATLHA